MRRGLFFLIIISILSAIAIWAADRPGRLVVDWQGWKIETSLLALMLGVLAFAALVWWLARLWGWLRTGHALSPDKRALRKARAGIKDIDDALSAFATGDMKSARKLSEAAIKRLDDSAMARVLAAQAAANAGDMKAADAHYQALLESERGQLIGLRGQLLTARRRGEVTKALDLATKAVAKAPKSSWVLKQAFELAAQSGQWIQAQQALNVAQRQGAFTKEEAQKHLAALYFAHAAELDASGADGKALQLALKAHKIAPDFPPATVLAARLHRSAGNIRRASKLIESTWKLRPHPSLAELYAVLKSNEDPQTRLKRFQQLAALNPDHRESHLRLAEMALNAGDLSIAREALQAMPDGDLNARYARLMLRLLEREGADATQKARWSDLAVKGTAEPVWSCQSCGSERARWLPHCPNCASFNSFVWDKSPQNLPSSKNGEVLGLLSTSE
ncbi:MAG: heme biosynthesis HemY N-terminal domain-containing protein [Sphingomonadales bacterium]|jgi:HemY protein